MGRENMYCTIDQLGCGLDMEKAWKLKKHQNFFWRAYMQFCEICTSIISHYIMVSYYRVESEPILMAIACGEYDCSNI